MTLLAQAKKLFRSRGTADENQMSHLKRLAMGEYDLQGHSISLQLLLLDTRQAVYEYHFLLVACCYNISTQYRFRDITTFTVYVTATCAFQFMCKQTVVKIRYIWTDMRTDGRTHDNDMTTAYTALAQRRAVKTSYL